MHITAVCPFCAVSYQVQPALRGQPIRCPNPTCRKIFTVASDLPVSEDSASRLRAASPPSPGNAHRSGAVGDMIPILPAEQAAPSAPENQTPSGGASPHVAEVLPVVSAESAAPRPVEAPSWHDAPPVRARGRTPSAPPSPPAETPPPRRRPPSEPPPVPLPEPVREVRPRPAAPTQPMPETLPEVADQPRELPPGVWEPPPVRRGGGAVTPPSPLTLPTAPEGGTGGARETEPAAEAHVPRVSKRRAWGLMLLLLLVVGGILGGVGWLVWQAVYKNEQAQFAEALADYKEGKFGSAASQFKGLAEKFPASENAPTYRFLEQLASLRGNLQEPGDLGAGLEQLSQFVKEHKNDPLLAEYGHDVGQSFLRLVAAFDERNASPTSEEPLALARRIEQTRQQIEAVGPDALSKADTEQIAASLAKVRLAVERFRKRRDMLAELRAPARSPMEAIRRDRALLQAKEKEEPGISHDPDVEALLGKFYDDHLASVRYEEAAPGASPPAVKRPRREETEPSVVFDPLLPTASPGLAADGDPIVLALVRGVLYALRRSNGEIKWTMRVGIDTTVLPERVPASEVSPERILVLSADTQTLTALDTDGNQLWKYHIGQPSLGRPVIINERSRQRAYLATYTPEGWVHEIELSGGKLLGRYRLGQRLSRGGTREGKTDRIYFPADDSCVYVLDVGQRRCQGILYSWHPTGSLRSAPLVIPSQREGSPGYLILNQTHGMDSMRLRVFELPLMDRHAAPVPLDPPPQIAGWTWFEPKQDGENVVVLSDAGRLGLFGIRQPGNRDQALFPRLQPGGLDLTPFLFPPVHEDSASRAGAQPMAVPLGSRHLPERASGRSQVVQMEGDDLWVLAYGRLRQVRLRWSNAAGPRPVAGWPEPLVLGSPLHAPQRAEDPLTGRATLFLVTQPLERPTCVASAVDDATGRILWQRQLGLVCQGEPLVLTPPPSPPLRGGGEGGGGPPVLLALDQGGGLFALDATRFPEPPRSAWQSDYQNVAPALDDNPQTRPLLLLAPDGQSAYEIAVPGKGTHLVVRHITWAGDGRRLRVRHRQVPLSSAVAGTPAVVGSSLIVPLAEGILARLPLPVPDDQPRLDEGGPDWRARLAPPNARCHVLALGGDRFLTTDGANDLACWQWSPGKTWRSLPEGRDTPATEREDRVVAPPLLLPGPTPQVVVADSAGVLSLLAVRADGSLSPNRSWNLQGQFTAGPFLYVLPGGGVRIGCVLGERRLVWLDPASKKSEPLWEYRAAGDGIVGQPQVVENLLVVAHQSGLFLGLDLQTGQARGPGYTLRGSVAPAACPVAFGPNRLFAPLSDGTALLLSLDHLRKGEE